MNSISFKVQDYIFCPQTLLPAGTTLKKGTKIVTGPSWVLTDMNPKFHGDVGVVLEDTAWGSKVTYRTKDGKEYTLRWGEIENGVEYIDVWDPASGQITITLKGHKRSVTSVTFSPDGSQLASASRDKTVKVIWKCFSSFSACLEFSRSNLAYFCRSGISLPASVRGHPDTLKIFLIT